MHTLESVRQKVVALIREQLCCPPDRVIQDKDDIINDLEGNSLDEVELVMAYEDEFEITIDESAYDSMRVVGAAVAYIWKKIK